MFSNQTIEKPEALGLHAMAAGLSEQLSAAGTYDEVPFADRLGLLVDKEADARDSRRLAARLKAAKLRYPAAVEDIDFRSPRGLDRSVILALAQGAWVRQHHNVLVAGPTGCGKSLLACALANAAIHQCHTISPGIIVHGRFSQHGGGRFSCQHVQIRRHIITRDAVVLRLELKGETEHVRFPERLPIPRRGVATSL
jgi:IstB-like ATP binding protein